MASGLTNSFVIMKMNRRSVMRDVRKSVPRRANQICGVHINNENPVSIWNMVYQPAILQFAD
tara:strand:- start:422 stop:607 length:186 start_codon:yes stop_codon:yes gene_type:complete